MEKACEAQVFESNQALHKAMHDDTHGSYIGVPREGESGLSEDSWDSEENDLPKRQQWSGQLDFMLSCIGYAVGLGNVWRFPYLCYVNGGGVFLIPYVLMVVISGMPCFVMEVALGQFMRKGGIAMWGIAPLFRGVGFSSVVVVFFSNIYYVVILAWSIYFLVHCFNMGELPWASCGHKWNTPACQEHIQCVNVSSAVGALSNVTNGTCGQLNGSVSPVVEFWERNVLRVSSGLEDTGSLSWGLVLCMIAAWILIYLCLWKGIRSTEKVVYFTATFPYIMLFALFVRSMMLDGAYNGIMYYLKPDWAKLSHPKVWVDACTQVFLSYGLGYASIATLGSFNSFHTNCYRNSIILAIINSGTSVFAGFLVFAVLGFMAQEQGVAISAVAQSGPGLAFIAYPQAVALMPLSQLWATLFFFMLILLGLDTQFVGVEAFITAVTDVFPEFLRGKGRREIFLAVCCVLKLLLGLYMVTEGGIYLFQLIDLFAVSGVTLLWQVFWQCIVVAWVYGGENFMADVTLMIGYRPNSIIKWSLAVVTPAMCMGMFLFTLLKHESVKYKEYVYPPWGEAIGWLMALSSMLCMPCTLLFLLLRSKKGNLVQRWKHLSMPVFESHVEFYRQGLDEVHDCPRDLECNAVSASHSIIPHSATHSPISSFCKETRM